MKVSKSVLGSINNGQVVSYNLENSNGIEVRVLNYGGIITDIIVPDKNGVRENVVLKYKKLESYEKNPSYFGALIGRTAGRVCDGEVFLNDEKISFNKNYDPHQGHGGNEGFDKKFYSVNTEVNEQIAWVELTRLSEDGEEYYPGNLDVKVRYSLNEENELKIEYFAVSDKDTLVNLTNHSYFNLSGDCKEDILDHKLYINSSTVIELSERIAATGKLLNIEGTEFDFRVSKKIGSDINGDHQQLQYGKGYDIPWSLENNNEASVELYHEKSGRKLEVFTDRQCAVIYSHNYPDNEVLENGTSGVDRVGLAIETQNPPIGENGCFIEKSILKRGEEFKSSTTYKFSVK